jgi:hypothetical protein
MRGLKRLLVPVVAAAAVVGLSLPAGADSGPGPSESGVAVEGWSPPLRVPIPEGRISVAASAISNRGHVAVAYRDYRIEDWARGYVIVRSPGGVWGKPHRLNPPRTDITGVEIAFDRAGILTAFWAFAVGPEGCCGESRPGQFRVATKLAGRAWSAHRPTGMLEDAHWGWWLGLSVAPSGRTAISSWRSFEPGGDHVFKLQFTVRVRPTADAPWGPARALSRPVAVDDPRFPSRDVGGDVAISNDGSATAIWSVCSLTNDRSCTIHRSTRRSSGTWTPPVRVASGLVSPGVLESTPAGFTAITWVNARTRTVVDLRTPDGIWSRENIPGAHFGLAVGQHGKVVLLSSIFNESGPPRGLWVTWRSSGSDWTTTRLARSQFIVLPLEPAIDRTGRIFVPWSELRAGRPPERGLMSTFSSAWDTTSLWDRARNAEFAAADVSRNGRAVAIRTVTNAQATSTTVTMRVLRPA